MRSHAKSVLTLLSSDQQLSEYLSTHAVAGHWMNRLLDYLFIVRFYIRLAPCVKNDNKNCHCQESSLGSQSHNLRY